MYSQHDLKKNKAGVVTISYMKAYPKCIVIKTICYWCKDGQSDERNRIQSSEIDPDLSGHLIYNQDNIIV